MTTLSEGNPKPTAWIAGLVLALLTVCACSSPAARTKGSTGGQSSDAGGDGGADGGEDAEEDAGACAGFPCCRTNADCPLLDAGVCGALGTCTAPCETQGDCPLDKVCNVLAKYLDPRLTLSPTTAGLYGAGECGPPCDAGANCAPFQVDGGPQLTCIDNPFESYAGRCRPSGCLSDAECSPPLDAGGPYKPWCDAFGGNRCVDDACRLGGDDCSPTTRCIPDGGRPAGPSAGPAMGECAKLPCFAGAGSAMNCAPDQFCCGDGDAGTVSCPPGVKDGQCYTPSNPPWCASCNPTLNDLQVGLSFGASGCNAPGPNNSGSDLGASICNGNATDDPSSGLCAPACTVGIAGDCPVDFVCAELPLYFGCGGCSTPCTAVSSGLYDGKRVCACLDDAGTGCPGQGDLGVLAEVASCGECPEGGTAGDGCPRAADDAGFNCGCAAGDDASCPPTAIGQDSFPSVCAPRFLSSNFACGLLVPVTCTSDGWCSIGSYCVHPDPVCTVGP